MHLGRWRVDAMLQTFLAQRMLGDISVTDAFPRSAVPFLFNGIAFVLFVLLVDELLVFLTVTAGYQLWAAGIAAGRQRFVRHGCLLSGQNKSPHGFVPVKTLLFYNFLCYQYILASRESRPRYYSTFAIERCGQPVERAVLLVVRGGPLNVKMLADVVNRVNLLSLVTHIKLP